MGLGLLCISGVFVISYHTYIRCSGAVGGRSHAKVKVIDRALYIYIQCNLVIQRGDVVGVDCPCLRAVGVNMVIHLIL